MSSRARSSPACSCLTIRLRTHSLRLRNPDIIQSPSPMATEDKWKANLEKVAFTKQFPGLLLEWPSCQGKTVETVTPLTGKQGAVVVTFTDGTFFVGPPLAPEAWELGQALVDARKYLEP